MGTARLNETLSPRLGLATADIASAKTGPYIPLTHHRQALAVVTTASVTAAKIVTVELLQATDAAGVGSKPLKSVITTATATGGQVAMAHADASELDEGFTHIAVRASTDNGVATQASATVLLGEGRFSP